MTTATTLGLATLLATAGAVVADHPMVLTEAQLDQVTAGLLSFAPELPARAAQTNHTDAVAVVELEDGLFLAVDPLTAQDGPRLGLKNLARTFATSESGTPLELSLKTEGKEHSAVEGVGSSTLPTQPIRGSRTSS